MKIEFRRNGKSAIFKHAASVLKLEEQRANLRRELAKVENQLMLEKLLLFEAENGHRSTVRWNILSRNM